MNVILLLFGIGVIGNILLQFVQQSPTSFATLKPYWEKYGIFPGALLSGLTTLIAGGLSLIVAINWYKFLGLYVGDSPVLFTAIAVCYGFLIGVLGDLYINRRGIFGYGLQLWYSELGEPTAAWWGGIAIAIVTGIAAWFYSKKKYLEHY